MPTRELVEDRDFKACEKTLKVWLIEQASAACRPADGKSQDKHEKRPAKEEYGASEV